MLNFSFFIFTIQKYSISKIYCFSIKGRNFFLIIKFSPSLGLYFSALLLQMNIHRHVMLNTHYVDIINYITLALHPYFLIILFINTWCYFLTILIIFFSLIDLVILFYFIFYGIRTKIEIILKES